MSALPSYRFFADADASPFIKRAFRDNQGRRSTILQGDTPGAMEARSFLLDKGFYSNPDGTWSRAQDATTARLEPREGGTAAIIQRPEVAGA